MKARLIVAGIIVFVLGVAVGAFGEHEKVKHDSHKSSTVATSTWFNGSSACPQLKAWNASVVAASEAIAKNTAWSATQTALSAQTAAASTAMRALLPLATRAGRSGLNFLISYETKLSTAVRSRTSASSFTSTQKKYADARVLSYVGIMTRAASTCSAG